MDGGAGTMSKKRRRVKGTGTCGANILGMALPRRGAPFDGQADDGALVSQKLNPREEVGTWSSQLQIEKKKNQKNGEKGAGCRDGPEQAQLPQGPVYFERERKIRCY